jgi:hypothetical protein
MSKTSHPGCQQGASKNQARLVCPASIDFGQPNALVEGYLPSANNGRNKALDSVPSCSIAFNVAKVVKKEKKRCSVPNCTATHPSCGCNMQKYHLQAPSMSRATAQHPAERCEAFTKAGAFLDFRYCRQGPMETMPNATIVASNAVRDKIVSIVSTAMRFIANAVSQWVGFEYADCCSIPHPIKCITM